MEEQRRKEEGRGSYREERRWREKDRDRKVKGWREIGTEKLGGRDGGRGGTLK